MYILPLSSLRASKVTTEASRSDIDSDWERSRIGALIRLDVVGFPSTPCHKNLVEEADIVQEDDS